MSGCSGGRPGVLEGEWAKTALGGLLRILYRCFDLNQLEESLGGLAPFCWDADAYFARDAELASGGAGAEITLTPARTAVAADGLAQ